VSKIIEAKAVISAQDKTGSVFDNLAKKFKNVEQTAKAFEGIKAPKFAGDLNKELERLKLNEKELQSVRKSFGDLERTLKAGPIQAAHYFRAVDEWKDKTVGHWRAVKASVDEAHDSHKKYFATAAKFGVHAAGIGGGAYLAHHVARSVARNAAARNREEIREEMAGFSPEEKAQAQSVADEISKQYPSISRTDVMADLRKNTSRLGTFDRAKAIAKDYARARIMNKLSGGDEHELEQVVRAAEGAGAANTPEDIREFINGFTKAKAANPDYTGENFRSDLAAAGSAKYGWDADFKQNVFPVLASHTSGFGNKTATTNSALVGGRMTKQSKARLKEAGLLDENGRLIDEAAFQANPFNWTMGHVKPVLEAKGVHFGEHMSEDDKRTTAGWASRAFSAKNAADAIISYLIDAPLVQKARKRKTEDIENADHLQKEDAGTAFESVKKQVGDFGTELANTSVAIGAMNKVAGDFANLTEFVRTGRMPESSPGMRRFLDWAQGNEPPMTGPIPLPMSDPRRGGDGERIPFPMSDPRKSADYIPPALPVPDRARMRDGVPMPFLASPEHSSAGGLPPAQGVGGATVQANVTGDLTGELTVKNIVEAGSGLLRIVSEIQELKASLYGHINTNGPGSTGKSSPDAAAPRTGYSSPSDL
jgi:hypothetical protein